MKIVELLCGMKDGPNSDLVLKLLKFNMEYSIKGPRFCYPGRFESQIQKIPFGQGTPICVINNNSNNNNNNSKSET